MKKEIFSYKTVDASQEGLFKDRGSKFYSYLFPVDSDTAIKDVFQKLKKEHPKARHFCSAYRLGIKEIIEKANDDGEPSGSAGLPILNQLKSNDLTNILCVVVRYFGGTKLGVSGLINAYKTACLFAIESALILEKEIGVQFEITSSFENSNHAFQLVNQFSGKIINQKYEEESLLRIEIPKKLKDEFLLVGNKIHLIVIKSITD